MNPLKLFESVKGLVIEQYRESGNLLSVLESAIESLQPSEDSAERTSDAFDINAAEGAWMMARRETPSASIVSSAGRMFSSISAPSASVRRTPVMRSASSSFTVR